MALTDFFDILGSDSRSKTRTSPLQSHSIRDQRHGEQASASVSTRKRKLDTIAGTSGPETKKACTEQQAIGLRGPPLGTATLAKCLNEGARLAPESLFEPVRPRSSTSLLTGSMLDRSLTPTRAPTYALARSSPSEVRRTGLNPHPTSESKERLYPGLIIRAAHHVTAQDEKADPATNGNLVQSRFAKICFKLRPQIVVCVYPDGSCHTLPISSHQGKDLVAIPDSDRKLYMALKDAGVTKHHNYTPYDPLSDANIFGRDQQTGQNKMIGQNASVCLGRGTTIMANEDIRYVGYLSRPATRQLLQKWKELQREAENQAWEYEEKSFKN